MVTWLDLQVRREVVTALATVGSRRGEIRSLLKNRPGTPITRLKKSTNFPGFNHAN